MSTRSANEYDPDFARARSSFERLFAHVAELYCAGGTSSLSAFEASELTLSIAFVLGIANTDPCEVARVLDVADPVALWRERLHELDARVEAALVVWREVVTTIPPIRNVALRDTLASLGHLRSRYDTRFCAHEVPCDIDYQLSKPIDPGLMGIDYVEVWLAQLLAEAKWLAQFDVNSCIAVLEATCPDYKGLHVNLCDLLLPRADELAPRM